MKKFRSIAESIKKFFNPLTWFDRVPISKTIPAPKEIREMTSLKAQLDDKPKMLSEAIAIPTQTQELTKSRLSMEEIIQFYEVLFKCEEYCERKKWARKNNSF